jgi:putative alpha-1,2-mannosidase
MIRPGPFEALRRSTFVAPEGQENTAISIRLENGRDLVLRNPTAGTGRDYLHGARWNGVELTSGMIPHTTLAQGGVLEFTMGKEPRAWGDLA